MTNSEIIERVYNCRVCNKTHRVRLDKNLVLRKTKFPFPHVFLHGNLKDLLTILYLDRDLQIRGAEVQKLSYCDDNVFSKDQTSSIVENLMNELERLRKDNENLSKEISVLKNEKK